MNTFILTLEHVALLRGMNVWWQATEYGAPGIDPKRPYGSSGVEVDIGKLLGEPMEGDDGEGPCYSTAQRIRFRLLHRETETALQIVLASGSFAPGTYVSDSYKANWRRAAGGQAR